MADRRDDRRHAQSGTAAQPQAISYAAAVGSFGQEEARPRPQIPQQNDQALQGHRRHAKAMQKHTFRGLGLGEMPADFEGWGQPGVCDEVVKIPKGDAKYLRDQPLAQSLQVSELENNEEQLLAHLRVLHEAAEESRMRKKAIRAYFDSWEDTKKRMAKQNIDLAAENERLQSVADQQAAEVRELGQLKELKQALMQRLQDIEPMLCKPIPGVQLPE